MSASALSPARGVRSVFALWVVAALTVAVSGALASLPPPAVPVLIWSPVLLSVWAWRRVPAVRAFADGIDLRAAVLYHLVRVVFGGLFLWEMRAGRLPAAFAMIAGPGDIAAGLLALPAAWIITRAGETPAQARARVERLRVRRHPRGLRLRAADAVPRARPALLRADAHAPLRHAARAGGAADPAHAPADLPASGPGPSVGADVGDRRRRLGPTRSGRGAAPVGGQILRPRFVRGERGVFRLGVTLTPVLDGGVTVPEVVTVLRHRRSTRAPPGLPLGRNRRRAVRRRATPQGQHHQPHRCSHHCTSLSSRWTHAAHSTVRAEAPEALFSAPRGRALRAAGE